MRRLIHIFLACALSVSTANAAKYDLPEIGSSSDTLISPNEEYQLGRLVMRNLRQADALLNDPQLDEYLESIGHRLAAQVGDENHQFTFFVVDDSRINAFALPGGFIGVNTGLLLATTNESELAGVLAHEISHVSQKHIARQIEQQSSLNLASAAAMLAAILLGVAGDNPELAQAVVVGAQGYVYQTQIKFTRDNEYEADRVGVAVLADAGFDPMGMPRFFETMQRRYGLAEDRVPDIIRTHPVTSARIAESRDRASQYPTQEYRNSTAYEVAWARLKVLTEETPADALTFFDDRIAEKGTPVALADLYGRGLSLLALNRPDEARKIFRELVGANDEVIAFHIALGDSELDAGQDVDALGTFGKALKLFPRNIPLATHYAEALMEAGDAERAHDILLDLLNNIRPTPEQVRLIAMAASASGDTAEAYYYMAEFHLLNGDLLMALDQLKLAMLSPDVNAIQYSRYEARMDSICDYLNEDGSKRRRGPNHPACRS